MEGDYSPENLEEFDVQSFLVRWHLWRKHVLSLFILSVLSLTVCTGSVRAHIPLLENAEFVITGRLIDSQGQPISTASISLSGMGQEVEHDAHEGKTAVSSREDGTWLLSLPELPPTSTHLKIERPHFETVTIPFDEGTLQQLEATKSHHVGDLTLERRITAGFWAATAIFVGLLMLIAFEKLHSTTAALAGISAIFIVTFLGQLLSSELYIISFDRALTYINWEVIFLLIAMMIMIAIIEGTGIFQWMAFQAYRISRGRSWILVLMLMAITAVASALLDNFTTMLLMTPISLQIALALGINPLALIIPEVLASNVGGISTLIGTPTNILIGAYANIGFSDFLVHQTVGVLVALIVMGAYVLFHYRAEWRKTSSGLSPKLYAILKKNAAIEDPDALMKSGLVFVLTLAGFVIGERYHIVPAVPALIGATALLIWLQPDVHEMIRSVDWTTLVFFMALFIVVGAVQEVGLISFIADGISYIVDDNLALAIFVMVFGAGTLSLVVANIPLAASLLPVAEFLTGNITGAGNKALYYSLSMGAAMGGNGLLIGGEANLVTAGIVAQTDSPITFNEFMRIGIPVTYLTLTIGFLWLLLHFVILGS